MNTVFAYSIGILFLLMCLFRILYALLYPDKFAEGIRKILFLETRQKTLFPRQGKDQKLPKEEDEDFHTEADWMDS